MTRLLIFVLALLLSGGCAKQEESASAPTVSDFEKERAELTARIKSKSQSLVQPGSKAPARAAKGDGVEFSVVDKEYVYDPTGKRDPFRSFVWDRPDKFQAVADVGPLGQFDLSQLEVVAVVWSTGNARALVEDPSGETYIVAEGSAIGKNQGHVLSIDDNAVVVKETYVDYLGQETTKDVAISMRRNEGG